MRLPRGGRMQQIEPEAEVGSAQGGTVHHEPSGQLPWTPSLVPEPPALCFHTLRGEAMWTASPGDTPRGWLKEGEKRDRGDRGCGGPPIKASELDCVGSGQS